MSVTAINGNKKNTLFLHSRADSVNNTSVLVGKIKKGPKGYGKQLDVTIPPLLAGAISRFTTTVKSGKYVQARCKTKNREVRRRSRSTTNHADTTDDYTSKCKQKKKKQSSRFVSSGGERAAGWPPALRSGAGGAIAIRRRATATRSVAVGYDPAWRERGGAACGVPAVIRESRVSPRSRAA